MPGQWDLIPRACLSCPQLAQLCHISNYIASGIVSHRHLASTNDHLNCHILISCSGLSCPNHVHQVLTLPVYA